MDVSKFDVDKPYVDFPVSFTLPESIKSMAISVNMRTCSLPSARIPKILTPDFMLLGPGVSFERGYEINFVEDDDILLTTYLNGKTGKISGGAEPGAPTVYHRVSRKRSAGSM